jgi:drug/metabolite transporter (DMT)-like permease
MIYALLASILWGVSYYSYSVLTKSGVPFHVLIACMIPVSLSTVIFCFFTNEPWEGTLLRPELFTYLSSTLLAQVFVYLSFKESDVVLVTIIEMTYPLTLILLCFIFEKRIASVSEFVAIFLILLGVFVSMKR